MGAQLRVYRRRIKSVQATKKITRAMELIATSRIAKAQARVRAAKPYADELTAVITAVGSQASINHPLTTPRPNPTRAAVIVVTSDRGLAGGYSSNALKRAEELSAVLRGEGKEVSPYLIGRKGVGYYRFRNRTVAASYTGFSEQPRYVDAKVVADDVIKAFIAGGDNAGANPDAVLGVDEIHIVYTEFKSALTQSPVASRVLPLVVEHKQLDHPVPAYYFEPDPEALLDALLPRYVESRVYAALLDSAASESAARRRAMKAATDNAEELIKSLTRRANSARQAEITQEISEIVGGANALADATTE